ncbi:MAG: preprotein translocase subunit SecG [Lachnospiraceae bacterium]|jgi:preprotein translocase subunit SecG|nr:preprotein translocase subunit SecG [Lachnospiraceae bacterium]
METLRTVLSIVYIIACVVLIVVVLMQEGKDQGLGAISGAAESYWGKNKGRSMEGKLVKLTTFLSVIFVVVALVLNMKTL